MSTKSEIRSAPWKRNVNKPRPGDSQDNKNKLYLTPLLTHFNNYQNGLALVDLSIKEVQSDVQTDLECRVMSCHFAEVDSIDTLERDNARKQAKLTARVTETSSFMHEEQEPNECQFEACSRTHDNNNVDDVFFLKLPRVAFKRFGGMNVASSSILERPVSQTLDPEEENICDLLESRNDFEIDKMLLNVFRSQSNIPLITLKPRPQALQLEIDL